MSSPSIQPLEVDLSQPFDWARVGDRPAHVAFRWHDLPLGARGFAVAELPPSTATLDSLLAEFGAAQLAARDEVLGAMPPAGPDGRADKLIRPAGPVDPALAWQRLEDLGQPRRADAEAVSLIICTRDRLDDLDLCLDALATLDPQPGEIIVVDNSAAGTARSLLEARRDIHFVREPRPGLSRARNAGLRAATGRIIAFTDDDALPRPNWIAEIAAAFEHPGVAAVTGLVLPAELASQAQQMFEFELDGLGRGFLPILFDKSFLAAARGRAAPVWRIGAGANMAFCRDALVRTGLFDERLGAGAAGCSEDSELWYRLLAHEEACLYEPRAIVMHRHRSDMAGLRGQMRAYMRGHVAALVAQRDRNGDHGEMRRILVELPKYLFGTLIRSLMEGRWSRARIALEESLGWIMGLAFLARWRWRADSALQRLAEHPHD